MGAAPLFAQSDAPKPLFQADEPEPIERLTVDDDKAPEVPRGIGVNDLAAPGLGEIELAPSLTGHSIPKIDFGPWSDAASPWLPELLNALKTAIVEPELRHHVIAILKAPGPAGSPDSVLKARAHALNGVGEHSAALRLLPDDPASMVQSVSLDDACAKLLEDPELTPDYRLLCLWHLGVQSRVDLNINLAEERGIQLPKLLLDAIALPADRTMPAPVYVAEPISLAMLRIMPVRVNEPIANPAIAGALAQNPGLDPAQRLALAEQAAAQGLLASAAMKDRYVALAAQVEPPAIDANAPPPPIDIQAVYARAQALAAIEAEAIPLAKLSLIDEFWQSLPLDLQPVLAPLLAPAFADFAATTELAAFAKTATAIQAMSGEANATRQWLARTSAKDPLFFWPLAALMDMPGWQDLASQFPLSDEDQANWLVLMDGLGRTIDEAQLVANAAHDQTGPVPFWLWRLTATAETANDQRLGVLAVAALTRGDPATAGDLARWRVLQTLRTLGMMELAERLAVRAWLSRSLAP